MKKALYAVAAIAILAACAKNAPEVPQAPEQPVASTQIKLNFDIESPGDAETKAVKQGWEAGDILYFWFDDLYQDASATNLVIRHHDLELTMSGSWEETYQVSGLADAIIAKAEKVQDYPAVFLGDANNNGIMDSDEFEYREVYHGEIYALWVSGNNLIDATGGWTRYESHPADGHNYLFFQPAIFGKPENMSPMVLSSGFASNSGYTGGGIDYIYDPVDNSLSLISATNINQKVSLTWKFYTNFQITITGLEPGHVYGLKSPQFGRNFMYINEYSGRFNLVRMINAATEAAHFGLEEFATANAAGEAVFFGQGMTISTATDFTFDLRDKTAGRKYDCVKAGKTITCSDTKLAAIKLKFADFNHWTVVGAFNSWGSSSVINMKRLTSVDSNDLRNGDWEADIIGYQAGQQFKLNFNNDWDQGTVGMKNGWSSYGLGDWGNNSNYLSGDSDNINIVIDGGDGDYHLFFSYPSHWFVVTQL